MAAYVNHLCLISHVAWPTRAQLHSFNTVIDLRSLPSLVPMGLFTALNFLSVLVCLAGATAIPESTADFIVKKDVVILGGGASGAHAAVRLREDYGKSIIVVEKQAELVRSSMTSILSRID